MKYALLIYPGELADIERMSDEEQRAITDEFLALREEEKPGVYGTAQLQPAESATTVRMQEGKTLTTDGPFANTKEVLGGLWLLEADSLAVALGLAARIPVLRLGWRGRRCGRWLRGSAARAGLPRRVGPCPRQPDRVPRRRSTSPRKPTQEAFAIAAERWPRKWASPPTPARG